MDDYHLNRREEVLAFLWGNDSTCVPTPSRVIDYEVLRQLKDYKNSNIKRRGEILSVYARATPELFTNPKEDFRKLYLKFHAKCKP
jgi:hypothetical protein